MYIFSHTLALLTLCKTPHINLMLVRQLQLAFDNLALDAVIEDYSS
jgi:hypothetical protein